MLPCIDFSLTLDASHIQRNILVKATRSRLDAVIYDAVICDFGFSRLEGHAPSRTELSEKLGHAAPELRPGGHKQTLTTFSSDHFACGSTFYELIRGDSPSSPPPAWQPPSQYRPLNLEDSKNRYLTESHDRSIERWLIPLIRKMWASDKDFEIVRLSAATDICKKLKPFGRAKGARK